MTIQDFEKEQGEILKNEEIRKTWTDYLSRFPHVSNYFQSAKQYENQVSIVNGKKVGADINLYKLFTEQSFNLLKKGGYCGIVIPSGIYTDLGTKQLRQMLFERSKITGLFCFENRKTIFENVDSRFKFVVLSFEKGETTESFPTAFMRHDVNELGIFPKNGAINISIDLVKKLSPDSYSIIEFKNEQEVNIAKKNAQYPLLSGDNAGWNLDLYGEELHMNRSAKSFLTKPTKYALYEGGMIHQFNHKFSEPRYWLNEPKIRNEFLLKRMKRIEGLNEIPKDLRNDYETYRLAIRKIARNTDSRTLISTVLPNHCLVGNSLSINFPFKHDKNHYNELRFNYQDLIILTSILNSYVVDFILRARVTTNLNSFYLYQLPIPRLKPKDKWYAPIVERAAKLICTTAEFADLWNEVMPTKWSIDQAATQEYERSKLRAELDGIIAHIYGLTEEEFAYILSTFPIVSEVQKVATRNAYEEVKKGLIK